MSEDRVESAEAPEGAAQGDAPEQPAGGGPAVSRDEVAEEAAGEETPADPVEALQRERDELYARVQRLSAEFDNYQKRMRREKAKWSQDTTRELMGGLLPVLDNLEYAVNAFDKGVKDVEALKKGVLIVQEELLRALSNYDVERMQVAEGDAFDSEAHQAVSMIPDPSVEKETVGGVARTGYTLGDHVLRPAQVLVKKPG